MENAWREVPLKGIFKVAHTEYDLFLISKYRNPLFGFAILCIVIFHSGIAISPSCLFLSDLKKICDVGVDIFLFLSGIGLYFSFNNGENRIHFYKKRFKRILSAYIPIACIWFAYKDFSWPHQNIAALLKDSITFFGDITLLSFWTKGNLTEWFIALILILYLFYPFVNKTICYLTGKKFIVFLAVLFCINSVAIYINICNGEPSSCTWIEIALPRIPVFIFGCWVASKVKSHKKIGVWFVFFCAFICVVCLFLAVNKPLILSHLVFRRFFVNGLLAVCISVLLSYIFDQIRKKQYLLPLEWLGLYTLEIYLFHEKILWLLSGIASLNNILMSIIAIGITLPCVPIYKLFYSKMLNYSLWCYQKLQFSTGSQG